MQTCLALRNGECQKEYSSYCVRNLVVLDVPGRCLYEYSLQVENADSTRTSSESC
jgi:hypothetical protein